MPFDGDVKLYDVGPKPIAHTMVAAPTKREMLAQSIEKAAEILRDPLRWTKRTLAVNKMRHTCRPQDTEAQAFCAIGAMLKVGIDERDIDKLDSIALHQLGHGIATFNDGASTNRSVVGMLMLLAGYVRRGYTNV